MMGGRSSPYVSLQESTNFMAGKMDSWIGVAHHMPIPPSPSPQCKSIHPPPHPPTHRVILQEGHEEGQHDARRPRGGAPGNAFLCAGR